jgi:hypothetical protein
MDMVTSQYLLNPIKYGKDNLAPCPLDDSPLLDAAGKKRVQQLLAASYIMHGQWILLLLY